MTIFFKLHFQLNVYTCFLLLFTNISIFYGFFLPKSYNLPSYKTTPLSHLTNQVFLAIMQIQMQQMQQSRNCSECSEYSNVANVANVANLANLANVANVAIVAIVANEAILMKPFCGSRYKPHKTNLVFFATILTKPLCSSCYNLHKTNLKFFATIITKPLCGSCYIATSVSVYSVGPGQPLQDTLKFRNIPNFLG